MNILWQNDVHLPDVKDLNPLILNISIWGVSSAQYIVTIRWVQLRNNRFVGKILTLTTVGVGESTSRVRIRAQRSGGENSRQCIGYHIIHFRDMFQQADSSPSESSFHFLVLYRCQTSGIPTQS